MRAAVLGSPISHSLSPVLHRAGYAALGLNQWSYERFELTEPELPGFLAGLDDTWRGLSLTMPLKRVCLAVADQVSDLAKQADAGNTLVRLPNGDWRAENTDVSGLVAALRPGWDATWDQGAVLGSGATARSAVLALAELGVTQVRVHARNLTAARQLASWAPLTVQVAGLEAWGDGAEPVVLSTLPGGVADALPMPRGRHGLLFDAVYANWPTLLARAAAAAGMQVVSGLDLLVHQAGLQFELFTGFPAPVEEMFKAGRAALGAR